MKKNNNPSKSPQRVRKVRKTGRVTIGMDLGDKTSRMCLPDEGGEVIGEASVAEVSAVAFYSALLLASLQAFGAGAESHSPSSPSGAAKLDGRPVWISSRFSARKWHDNRNCSLPSASQSPIQP